MQNYLSILSIGLALFIAAGTPNYLLAQSTGSCPTRTESERQRRNSIGYIKAPYNHCTGVLLSPHVVLTAAHCVLKENPKYLYFSLNPEFDDKKRGSLARVSRVFIHPSYSPKKAHSDLALVQLASTHYGSEIKSFYPVAKESDFKNSKKAVVVGYGMNRKAQGLGRRRLKRVTIDYGLKTPTSEFKKYRKTLLTIRESEKESICYGDSGAPILKQLNGRMQIIGMVSAGGLRVNPLAMQEFQRLPGGKAAYMCRARRVLLSVHISEYKSWIQKTQRKISVDSDFVSCP